MIYSVSVIGSIYSVYYLTRTRSNGYGLTLTCYVPPDYSLRLHVAYYASASLRLAVLFDYKNENYSFIFMARSVAYLLVLLEPALV